METQNTQEDRENNKFFDKCPNCKGQNRFFETTGRDAVMQGKARKGWQFCFIHSISMAIDKSRTSFIPIGATIPGLDVVVDICSNCGTVYAIKVSKISGRIEAQSSTDILPPGYGSHNN